MVDGNLVFGLHAGQCIKYLAVDGSYCLGDAFAEVAGLVAIAQFDGLMCASRSTGGNGSTTHGTVFQYNIHFHCWIAAAVEDFACGNVDDGGHGLVP